MLKSGAAQISVETYEKLPIFPEDANDIIFGRTKILEKGDYRFLSDECVLERFYASNSNVDENGDPFSVVVVRVTGNSGSKIVWVPFELHSVRKKEAE